METQKSSNRYLLKPFLTAYKLSIKLAQNAQYITPFNVTPVPFTLGN